MVLKFLPRFLPLINDKKARHSRGMDPSLRIPQGPDMRGLLGCCRWKPMHSDTTKSGSSTEGQIAWASQSAVPIGLFLQRPPSWNQPTLGINLGRKYLSKEVSFSYTITRWRESYPGAADADLALHSHQPSRWKWGWTINTWIRKLHVSRSPPSPKIRTQVSQRECPHGRANWGVRLRQTNRLYRYAPWSSTAEAAAGSRGHQGSPEMMWLTARLITPESLAVPHQFTMVATYKSPGISLPQLSFDKLPICCNNTFATFRHFINATLNFNLRYPPPLSIQRSF